MEIIKNPAMRGQENKGISAAGSILEDVTENMNTMEVLQGAGYSAKKGNDGHFCTVTCECMVLCNWF